MDLHTQERSILRSGKIYHKFLEVLDQLLQRIRAEIVRTGLERGSVVVVL